MSIELISSVVAIAISLLVLYKSWRTAPADIAKKYQEIASQAADDAKHSAERAEKFSERCESLEERLETVEAENDALRNKLKEMSKTLDEWQHGIELLVHQLKANNLAPVWTPKAREENKK